MVNSGSFEPDVDRNENGEFTKANHVAESPHSVNSMHSVSGSLCENDFATQTADSLPVSQAIEPTATKTEYKCNMPQTEKWDTKQTTEGESAVKEETLIGSDKSKTSDKCNVGHKNRNKISICCSVPLEKVQSVLEACSVFSNKKFLSSTSATNLEKEMCLYCDRSFTNPSLKQKHVDRYHTVKNSRRLSTRRQKLALQSTTRCMHCEELNESECNLDELFRHLIANHSEKYFGCIDCRIRFQSYQVYRGHMSKVHGTKLEVNKITTDKPKKNVDNLDKDLMKKALYSRTKRKLRSRQIDEEKEAEAVAVQVQPAPEEKETRQRLIRAVKPKKVVTTKISMKQNLRMTRQQSKILENSKNTKRKLAKIEKIENDNSSKYLQFYNPYSPVEFSFKYKKITDHSIDNLKIGSMTFDDVFDKAFFNRVKCNIQENLSNFIDGKLLKTVESENRILSFQKTDFQAEDALQSDGSKISSNAVTPVATLLTDTQFGEDIEAQIEYGSKPSKKKTTLVNNDVHYKYFTRRKYQAVLLENKQHRDLSKLDMWTQLAVKNRQQKIICEQKTDKEIVEYKNSDEYKLKMQIEELDRILNKRGPLEDLKEEAIRSVALEKLNGTSAESNLDSYCDVTMILDGLLNNLFPMETPLEILNEVKAPRENEVAVTSEEMPLMLNLRRVSTEVTLEKVDPTTNLELTGEWARSRIYLCASCGMKLPNAKMLMDHKNLFHEQVWCQHYEFVGNQGELYRHLSIPGLGKVGELESCGSKMWKRSEARTCSKCNKQFNTLGELHRHVLECGGDWSWMLARKKYKYRPYGSKTRKKRRGGLLKLLESVRERKAQIAAEKRETAVAKKLDGPRPKASDAETIERMLANLPAKRVTRKIMCLKDGFQKTLKNKINPKAQLKNQKQKIAATTAKLKEIAIKSAKRSQRLLRSNSDNVLLKERAKYNVKRHNVRQLNGRVVSTKDSGARKKENKSLKNEEKMVFLSLAKKEKLIKKKKGLIKQKKEKNFLEETQVHAKEEEPVKDLEDENPASLLVEHSEKPKTRTKKKAEQSSPNAEASSVNESKTTLDSIEQTINAVVKANMQPVKIKNKKAVVNRKRPIKNRVIKKAKTMIKNLKLISLRKRKENITKIAQVDGSSQSNPAGNKRFRKLKKISETGPAIFKTKSLDLNKTTDIPQDTLSITQVSPILSESSDNITSLPIQTHSLPKEFPADVTSAVHNVLETIVANNTPEIAHRADEKPAVIEKLTEKSEIVDKPSEISANLEEKPTEEAKMCSTPGVIPKGKIKKMRGLNDCIAMLTNKLLSPKIDDASLNVVVQEVIPDDAPMDLSIDSKSIPINAQEDKVQDKIELRSEIDAQSGSAPPEAPEEAVAPSILIENDASRENQVLEEPISLIESPKLAESLVPAPDFVRSDEKADLNKLTSLKEDNKPRRSKKVAKIKPSRAKIELKDVIIKADSEDLLQDLSNSGKENVKDNEFRITKRKKVKAIKGARKLKQSKIALLEPSVVDPADKSVIITKTKEADSDDDLPLSEFAKKIKTDVAEEEVLLEEKQVEVAPSVVLAKEKESVSVVHTGPEPDHPEPEPEHTKIETVLPVVSKPKRKYQKKKPREQKYEIAQPDLVSKEEQSTSVGSDVPQSEPEKTGLELADAVPVTAKPSKRKYERKKLLKPEERQDEMAQLEDIPKEEEPASDIPQSEPDLANSEPAKVEESVAVAAKPAKRKYQKRKTLLVKPEETQNEMAEPKELLKEEEPSSVIGVASSESDKIEDLLAVVAKPPKRKYQRKKLLKPEEKQDKIAPTDEESASVSCNISQSEIEVTTVEQSKTEEVLPVASKPKRKYERKKPVKPKTQQDKKSTLLPLAKPTPSNLAAEVYDFVSDTDDDFMLGTKIPHIRKLEPILEDKNQNKFTESFQGEKIEDKLMEGNQGITLPKDVESELDDSANFDVSTTSVESDSIRPCLEAPVVTKAKPRVKSIKKKPKAKPLAQGANIFCEICNKTFIRPENLTKHKGTLTHIAKLSEIEAFEAQKARDAEVTLADSLTLQESITPLEFATPEDSIAAESLETSHNLSMPLETSTAPVISELDDTTSKDSLPDCTQDALKLVEIINDVLNKPLAGGDFVRPDSFVEHILTPEPEIKRCKSLGERKSFDSDKLEMFSPMNSPSPLHAIDHNFISKISTTADIIVEKQISLLENMIEDNRINFTSANLQSNDEYSNHSNSSGFSMLSSKQDDCPEITFTHNTNIITNLIKPALDGGNLMRESHYEEISEDSTSSHFAFEEQKSRKVLNRDEELFLECCSLLKGGSSDLSDLSKKQLKSTQFLNNFGLKPLDELEWLEQKELSKPRDNFEYSSNNYISDSVNGNYYNEMSYSNMSVLSSKGDNYISQPPMFEDISTGSDYSSARSTGFQSHFDAVSQSGSSNDEFEKFQDFDNRSVDEKKEEETLNNDDACLQEDSMPEQADSIPDHDSLAIIKPPMPKLTQSFITNFAIPKAAKEEKKLITKGAMKVFEGLKVSIPKEGLDMAVVINCSPPAKQLELEKQGFDKLPEKVKKIKLPPKKGLKAGLKGIGNKLGLKITKKKYLTQKVIAEKKSHDVYDFEETQDVEVFKSKSVLPVYQSFKQKSTEPSDDIMPSKKATKVQKNGQNAKGGQDKKIDMPKSLTKKKCMIMGRIFKNAVKPKLVDEIKDIPVVENSQIVENYVLTCQNSQEKEHKLTEEEMNMLFDSLLNEGRPKPSIEAEGESLNKTLDQKLKKIRHKKRIRTDSPSTSDEEFSIRKAPKRQSNKKGASTECVINLEQELKECIGVASRKSQRKCTSGKQNVLVEYWSSDESSFEVDENSPNLLGVPLRGLENSVEVAAAGKVVEVKKKKSVKKVADSCSSLSVGAVEEKVKRVASPAMSESASNVTLSPNVCSGIKSPPPSAGRQKRTAVDTLYYWSSSSEDEAQNIIEVKPVREDYNEDDRPLQHGWIVGDSPKKLVTMLAHAKGKKLDGECVKRNKKKSASA